MSGHEHNQQLIKSDEGIYYIISGAGSEPEDVQQGKSSLFASSKPGFARAKITKHYLTVQFISNDGEIEYEQRIKK
jgi:hypothetical protein